MVNCCLVWLVEMHYVLYDVLCGFHTGKSLMGHLVALEIAVWGYFFTGSTELSFSLAWVPPSAMAL